MNRVLQSLVSALLLLAPAAARGVVTFVDVAPDLRMINYSTPYYVDINADGTNDVWFIRSPDGFAGLKVFTTTSARIQSVPSEIATRYSWRFVANDTIGPTPVPGADWYYSPSPWGHILMTDLLGSGQVFQNGFFPNQDGYIGVELTLADGVHYGYLHVRGLYLSTIGDLRDYAFETTPGVPIIAGSVPEPRRVGLLLLAMLLCTNRRRRAESGATILAAADHDGQAGAHR